MEVLGSPPNRRFHKLVEGARFDPLYRSLVQ